MSDRRRTLLRMCGVTKRFGPVTALNNVDLEVAGGTVYALCGENGAGKSTLMKILAGVYPPDAGFIELDGVRQTFARPGEALAAGISMLYQELDLAPDLTVTENLFLGAELRRGPWLDQSAMRRRTAELIARYGFRLDPEARIRELPVGECQVVELLKAIHRRARILVMDEPTSSLSEAEAERLFAIIRQLREDGLAIIYISHRMEEVMALADVVTVLRDGEMVHTAPARELTIPAIVGAMVGRELSDFYPRREPHPGEVILQVEKLASAEGISDISFALRRGTITGLAGLIGAGRSELARVLFGLVRPTAGRILLRGREVRFAAPGAAIDAGIGLVTEDRRRSGLCVNLPCSWNLALPCYPRVGMRFRIAPQRERALALRCGEAVRVKWRDPEDPAASLSGGNQQKLLLGRWLPLDPEILIVDEPTRGVDVGARREIYTLLNELADRGKAVLVISSDLPELFGITERLLVMRRGRLVAERETAKTTPEEVMQLAAVEE